MIQEITSLGSHLKAVEDFLGAPFSRVNRLIRLMVIEHDGAIPDYLRGAHRLDKLPRHSYDRQSHIFPIPLIREKEIASRVMWIIENLRGKWCMDEEGFSFELAVDAVAYRLRWE